MSTKKLSFWQIWNMSFGFLGIQFGFALQGGNMSRIFQTLGATEDSIPMLWIAAPLTGLIVQPIIGYLSDRTWHPKFGRRIHMISLLAGGAGFLLMTTANEANDGILNLAFALIGITWAVSFRCPMPSCLAL